MIATDLQSLITAMADCKAALTEQGLTLDRNPRLTDLPALINAIGEGTTPALSEVQPRDLTTNLNLIAPTLKEIETALTNKGVDVGGGCKITDIPSKIREIVVSKDVTFMIFEAMDYFKIQSGTSKPDYSGTDDIAGLFILEDGTQFKMGENGTTNHITKVNGYYFDNSTDAKNYATAYANTYPNNYSSTQYLKSVSGLAGTTKSGYIQRNWLEVTLPVGAHQVQFNFGHTVEVLGTRKVSFEVTEDKSGKKLVFYGSGAYTTLTCFWL